MLDGRRDGLLGGAAAAGLGAGRARGRGRSSRRVAGALMALIHAFLVITLRANQIVSGLALTIFAALRPLVVPRQRPRASRTRRPTTTFSVVPAAAAARRAGRRADPVRPERARLRLVGLRRRSCAWYLARTRPGLNVRAVGESPAAADAMGINVTGYRYAHTLVGGAFAGVGGATFSLAITPQWVDGLTRRRRLDRDRARDLRLLAAGAVPRRRVPLRRVPGAAVHVPGEERADRRPAGALPGAAVRDDDRRARRGLVGGRAAAARRAARRSASRTCARSGRPRRTLLASGSSGAAAPGRRGPRAAAGAGRRRRRGRATSRVLASHEQRAAERDHVAELCRAYSVEPPPRGHERTSRRSSASCA